MNRRRRRGSVRRPTLRLCRGGLIALTLIGAALFISFSLHFTRTGALSRRVSVVFEAVESVALRENSGRRQANAAKAASVEREEAETPPEEAETEEDGTVLSLRADTGRGYLNHCVFLGDSRTVSLVNYGLINDDAALAQIGISHPSFKSNTFCNNAGKQYTLSSYLASHQSPVIYIALGVNGINDPSEEHYKSTFLDLIVTVIREAPDSRLVLMAIGPVNDGGPYKNTVQNAWIRKYNEFLLSTAREKHLYYLNIAELLTGADGQLLSAYDGGDGLHYTREGCKAILDYVVRHPVAGIPDDGDYVVRYVKPRPENTRVTMDESSGLDEEKLKELMDLMAQEETPDEEQEETGEEEAGEETDEETDESEGEDAEEWGSAEEEYGEEEQEAYEEGE